jgi:hypothetical protein
MLKRFLVSTAALALMAGAAEARLQLTLTSGVSTFTCFDGEAGCDLAGGANSLLTINTTVGAFFVAGTLSGSTFGPANNLQFSASSIVNNGLLGSIKMIVSDTGFAGPVGHVTESGSLTFNANLGAPDSTLAWWADPADAQGADPFDTPGALLFQASGHALSDPDSFDGTHEDAFAASGPFSMTEAASLTLRGGGSVTGFDQSMTASGVPEPSAWAMVLAGFGFLSIVGIRKRTRERLIA